MQYDLLKFCYSLRRDKLLESFEVGTESGSNWLNPLKVELNPICDLLVLLGDLFMGPCIVGIFQYTCISNKMQRYTVHLYVETALHVSGGTSIHHQERIQLHLQHLVLSHQSCYLPLSWKCWNRFECAVGGVSQTQHTQLQDILDIQPYLHIKTPTSLMATSGIMYITNS
jgi:hypothetical protein